MLEKNSKQIARRIAIGSFAPPLPDFLTLPSHTTQKPLFALVLAEINHTFCRLTSSRPLQNFHLVSCFSFSFVVDSSFLPGLIAHT